MQVGRQAAAAPRPAAQAVVAAPAAGRRQRRVSGRQARRLLQPSGPGGTDRLAGGAAAGARVAHQRLVRAERVG